MTGQKIEVFKNLSQTCHTQYLWQLRNILHIIYLLPCSVNKPITKDIALLRPFWLIMRVVFYQRFCCVIILDVVLNRFFVKCFG